MFGTIRRDRVDHVIVVKERHLKRIHGLSLRHYHGWRNSSFVRGERSRRGPAMKRAERRSNPAVLVVGTSLARPK